MKLTPLFFFILLFLIFSCGEKENPNSTQGQVSITGIKLGESSLPGGRSLATFRWKHRFASSVRVTFSEISTGKSYQITINPNDFEKAYTIQLPFGSYAYEGLTTGEVVANYLPIRILGKLQVDGQSESLALESVTEYGLFTFSKSNLNAAPKIVEPLTGTFSTEPDFFFAYVKKGTNLKVELALSNGKSFRIGANALDFLHQQFQVRKEPSEVLDFFETIDFEVKSEVLDLQSSGFPQVMFPYNLGDLPASQKESSGLQWIQGRLFSINDGGNPAEIYELNPQTRGLIRTIKVGNAANIDWEDLASSTTHLFIGDFGNNNGNRTDLRILKIPISSVLGQTEVSAELIEFSYPDQSDFSGSNPNHNFDCEAMIFTGNRLYLFSKNRGDLKTKQYSLSTNPGKQVAVLEGSFDSKGLITGATISPEGKNIVLVGYENRGVSSRSFLWTFASGLVLSGPSNQFFIGSPAALGQTEGIALDSQGEVKISGEQISLGGLTVPAKLFEIDLTGILNP